MGQEEKIIAINESNDHVSAKKGPYDSNLGVFSTPKDLQYLTMIAPVGSKFYLQLPSESRENNCLACAIKESNDHVLAKEWP